VRGGLDESGTKHEILGRITNQHQLWEHHEIRTERGRLVTRAANDTQVAVDVSNDWIDLGDRDREIHVNRL
jgi:hypothetical protein